MSKAGIYNLCINRGSTFGPITVRLKDKLSGDPIDLTGINARSKIRKTYGDSTELAVFTATVTDVTNGEIQFTLASDIDIPANITPLKFAQISEWETKLDLTRDETKLFNIGLSPYVWDLETYDNASPPVVTRRLNGMVAVTEEVTS